MTVSIAKKSHKDGFFLSGIVAASILAAVAAVIILILALRIVNTEVDSGAIEEGAETAKNGLGGLIAGIVIVSVLLAGFLATLGLCLYHYIFIKRTPENMVALKDGKLLVMGYLEQPVASLTSFEVASMLTTRIPRWLSFVYRKKDTNWGYLFLHFGEEVYRLNWVENLTEVESKLTTLIQTGTL